MPTTQENGFYTTILKILNASRISFLLGGTFAVNALTGISRETKDMDIFSKPSDFPHILNLFKENGFKTEIEDERWIAKISKNRHYFDVIWNSSNSVTPVTDEWFKKSQTAKVLGVNVHVLPPTELIWAKAFVQDRYKNDTSDIAHLLLRQNKNIDWKRLLSYFDQYWEVLLGHILKFRFIYPSERELVPRPVLDELLSRLKAQIELPTPQMKVCRGRLFSRGDYEVDIKEWGFADMIGGENEPKR